MKCTNPNCSGEWTPPPGKSLTVCPFCGEQVAMEKKKPQSFDNVGDTLVYIKEQYGEDTLLSGKVYTFFADLTHNQLNDETELIKQLCEKGALDCLKDAIGKHDSEYEAAVNRALFKLPKYLQDSPSVAEMLHDFTTALGWKIKRQTVASKPEQNHASQFKHSNIVTQDGSTSNTSKIVVPPVGSVKSFVDNDWRLPVVKKFADIHWYVLAVENKKALLISEKILEMCPYNVEYKDIVWKKCTLRKYLNGEFYNKLGTAKSAIAETRNSNHNNPWYGTAGGNATTDKVFLLSLDEVCRYFGDSTAELKNAIDSFWPFEDKNSLNRIANYENERAWWWLRSPGCDSDSAATVSPDGNIDVYGNSVNNISGGIRPALWLNL